jgi:Tfp pilus assembly protein PilV
MSIKIRSKSIFKFQDGDTIIEVMISIAVLSTVFISCYSIINKSVQNIQKAKNHAQAIQIVQSQVEDFRAYVATNSVPNPLACFYISGGALTYKAASCYLNSSGAVVTASQTPNFLVNITNTHAPGSFPKTYIFTATWQQGLTTASASEEYHIP